MKLLLIAISLLLISCTPEVIYKYKYVEITRPVEPAPLNLQAPYFYVVSPVNLDEFLKRIEEETNGVFFAITPRGYETLAKNNQEIKRYIIQSKAVLSYYDTLLRADQSRTD